VPKDLSIPYDEISNPQTLTQRLAREFEAHDLNIHANEAITVDDDDRTRTRHISVKTPTTMFFMPEAPWKKTPIQEKPHDD